MSFHIKTYGCKVNTYDSSLIERNLEASGIFKTDIPNIFLLNTCAVTKEATNEAVREVRRLKRKDPSCIVVVTGCAAQVDTDKFESLQQADLIIANSHKQEMPTLLKKLIKGELSERVFKSNIFKKEEFEPGGGQESAHTRAFLKIQDGCNSFCTFCVIPFARGKSRSLSIDALESRVNELYEQGVREVVLTGVHIGDYEFGLENLIEKIILNTRMPRIRLTSLEPIELSDRLIELYHSEKMCRHFHMSIQSASTPVLEKMKRKYTSAEVEAALLKIYQKVPDAFVGMDVIVGFPGEGEDEFLETYQNLARLPWTRIHVFPYSERPGTYAVRLDNKVPDNVISRRADRLRELSSARYRSEALKQIGKVKFALGLNQGALTRDYWSIKLSEPIPASQEVAVQITGLSEPAKSRLDCTLDATLL